MDQVRLMTAQVPEHLKDAVKILLQGEDEDLEDLLPIKLSAIQNIADKCVALASSVEKKFEEVMDLAGEVLESSTSAKGTYEDKLKDVEAELAVARQNRETANERKKVSKDQFDKLQRAVNKAERDYEKAMDSMPGGWSMIGMNTVEGMSNAFTTVLSGVGRIATLGIGSPDGEAKSLVEKAASKLWSGKSSNEKPLDEKTIDAYTKVPELKSYADSLKMTCIEDDELKANVAQSDESIRYLHAQFKHILQEIGIKGNNNVKNLLIALSDEGMQICTQLKELTKAMNQEEEAGRGLAQKIITFHEKVLILQVEGNAILGSCPTESKAPNQSLMPQAQDTSKSATQQAVQDARFKIEASTAQLDSTKERYDKSCDKLMENTEKLGKIIAEIKKLDIHKINFQQIRETLIKGIRALGELREQWTKLVRFFQTMSNIIRCSMSTSLAEFTEIAEKAEQRKEETERYTLTKLIKDMIYKQAFEAAKIAHLVNMISGAYVDVSNRYIMSRVAGLGKLQGYDDTEKDRNALQREFNALVEGCEEAQEGIKDVVLEHKREFDRRVEMRIKTIKTELSAALPPPLPSDRTDSKMKEVVKKAMDTVKEVVPTTTKGFDPDDFC